MTGQGNNTEGREDTEEREDTDETGDQLATYREGGSSEEEASEGNKKNVVFVDIE
jgi:hypothetical protein